MLSVATAIIRTNIPPNTSMAGICGCLMKPNIAIAIATPIPPRNNSTGNINYDAPANGDIILYSNAPIAI